MTKNQSIVLIPVLTLSFAFGVALLVAGTESSGRASKNTTAVAEFKADDESFASVIRPFLDRHCVKCHGPERQKGDFRVDADLPNEFLSRSVTEKWSEVLNMLNSGDMPPEEEPQPDPADVRRVAEWIEGERLRAERARRDRTVVLRRLNREEYNNTIRDLIGVELDLVDEFPEDPAAGGFDNNGGALNLSPLQLELYLRCAQAILDHAIVEVGNRPKPIQWRFQLEDGNRGPDRYRVRLDEDQNRRVVVNGGNRQTSDGMVELRHDFEPWIGVSHFHVPAPGHYAIRVRAGGMTPPAEAVRRVGPELHIQRQEERERGYSDPAKRAESRARFEKWTLPYVRRHFEEDARYHYGPPRLKFSGWLGGARRSLTAIDIEASREQPEVYEIKAWFTPEDASVRVENGYQIPGHWYLSPFEKKHDDFPRPVLFIDWLEIEGPLLDDWPPAGHRRLLFASPNRERDEVAYAREVLAKFMRRAYRRPLRAGELDRKVAHFERARSAKPSFEAAIKLPLLAVLTSPNFLFLVEGRPGQPLNDHELAARLSYFLWSSMPDAELFRLAEEGHLKNPEVLRAQADRMLADAKSGAFVKNFAGQWLGLRKVGVNAPVRDLYTRYDEHLETSMRRESEVFFEHILRNDRSVREFLRSDYVTINERLARFYGIPGVDGDHFRRVGVPAGVQRGGLVTQASILAITSNGTRTSPVWRGVWILANLLGDPPPPPPPNAGDIPPGPPGRHRLSLRERLQAHREQPQCARCHDAIDPLGFALENYAASGEWREKDSARYMGRPSRNDPDIDARARLPDGTEFVGVAGLQEVLLARSDRFLHCLAGKLYTYALGREPGYADQPVLDDAVRHLKANGHTLRSLIHHIVSSELFRTK